MRRARGMILCSKSGVLGKGFIFLLFAIWHVLCHLNIWTIKARKNRPKKLKGAWYE